MRVRVRFEKREKVRVRFEKRKGAVAGSGAVQYKGVVLNAFLVHEI